MQNLYLFQENPKCWNTLDIQEYSSSQKLEISRNSKFFFPPCIAELDKSHRETYNARATNVHVHMFACITQKIYVDLICKPNKQYP